MRTQILLGFVLAASAVGGYYEVEIRDFASTTASRVKSSLPFGLRDDTNVSSDEDTSPGTGDASPAQGDIPPKADLSPSVSKEGLNDALRSLRGAPSDAATEQRSEYLRRLDAETGNARNSPVGMAPPIPDGVLPPGHMPPVPVLSGELPEGPDASLPSNEEVDSFEMDAEEFDPDVDAEVIDEEPIDDADLAPDEGPEDGV